MTNVYGLVICGGQSTRMSRDKSLLDYHGRPQRYYLYEQLQPFCKQVFLSCNEQQAADIPEGYHFIADAPQYHNTGPMAALLSAFDRHPDKTFIVLACDYPFFTSDEITQLANAAGQAISCAAFCHEENNIYEPLLAIYQPAMHTLLQKAFAGGQYSLQRVLKEADALKLFPRKKQCLQSVDTPEGYEAAVRETRQIK
jgi:molybdopterin-guanine dinucleotide biosynthesis protein A